MRKTSTGVHNFVLGAKGGSGYAACMASSVTAPGLKARVAEFWNAAPCGSRYLAGSSFENHAWERYRLEPYIFDFAQFSSSRGQRVLEIGVGMGADYEQWLRAGAIATGVDLSQESLAHTRQRCELAGLRHDLHLADAENLPFPNETFGVVYSYGVMHHSPDTLRCVNEARRVLKPGGTARIMLYHDPSITGLMLWLRFGLWKWQTIRRCVFDRLESPGTKTYSVDDVLSMMSSFENVAVEQVFSPGDLLLNRPSPTFRGWFYSLVWKLFPRSIVRRFGRRWGLFLLITARKPI